MMKSSDRMQLKKFVLFLVFAPILIAAMIAVTMALWNWLVPSLFGGPVITFWQSAGLLLLSKILFGGFGKGHWKNKHKSHRSHWRKRWQEKMESMSPEEKEKWKMKMRKCGPWWDEKAEKEDQGATAQGSSADQKEDKFEE